LLDCRMTEDLTTLDRLTIPSSVSSPYTEHLGQEPVVLRFTAEDAAREIAG
jgi:hypothetical protein